MRVIVSLQTSTRRSSLFIRRDVCSCIHYSWLGMKRKAMGPVYSSSSRTSSSATAPSSESHVSNTSESFSVPLEVLEELFLNLPPAHVVRTCRLVCRQWKEVADSESLWRERCRREGYHRREPSKTPKDWRVFYFLCKKRRNLIKNPRAEHEFQDWEIQQNGGDKWSVEDVMAPHPDDTVQKNFVTSFQLCMKSQLIDLEKEGYNPAFMDNFQPDIKISDWYAPRWDCGSLYKICVELLNSKKKPVQTFGPDTVRFGQWNDREWKPMIHVFRNYGPGVRYIRFTHGGQDTQFWAGWYGIRVTDSCVEICEAVDI